MDRRRFLALAAPLGAAALAGCTDSPGGTDSPTTTETDTATAADAATATGTGTDTAAETPTPTATDEPTPTATATAAAAADQTVVVAPEGELRFEPQTFSVAVGDVVRWTWEEGGHNVSPTEGEIPADSDWSGEDEQTYSPPHTYSHAFEVAGEYAYHCDPHRTVGMTGSFTVE